MRSLFLMTMCLSVVFLLSCGGGEGSSLSTQLPGMQTGRVEVGVAETFEGWERAGDGVSVQLWSGEDLKYWGTTDYSGVLYFENVQAGKYLIVVDSDTKGYPVQDNIEVRIGETSCSYFLVDCN